MRYVKIGDSYFNPQRIDRIKGAAEVDVNRYKPIVKVYLTGKTFYYDAVDLGLEAGPLTEFEDEWVALGAADAMAETVVQSINEALE
jgi:hypothetical protein